MIKYYSLITLLIFSINSYSQNLTKEQAVEDLEYLYKSIQNVHPDLYWFKVKSDADNDFNNLLEKVESGIDQEEFYKLTAEFVADFNTSHLNVTLPFLSLGDFSKSEKLNPLPVEVLFTSKGLFIKERISKNGTINKGDKVLEINGNTIDLIFSEFQKLDKSVGNFEVWNNYSKFFMEYYRIQFGDTSKFHFKYVDFETKDILSETLNAISTNTWGKFFMQNFPKEKFHFDFYKEQKIGVIKILTFANLNGFDTFLQRTFQKIEEFKLEHLIIDIRDNEGGSTIYVDELLNYCTTKKYKYDDYYIGKVSQEKREDINRHMENCTEEERAELLSMYKLNWVFDNEIGDTVLFSGDDVVHVPLDKENKFNGKLYLLINERVGSTSQLFTQAFKCSNLGLIIGQETGEATIFFGDGPSLKLPNSNLQLNMPSKKFISPCQQSRVEGIKPDYEVDYNPSKLLIGVDEVLDFTFNLITK